MNGFVFVQLNTADAKAAQRFYDALFDWKFNEVAMGGGSYTMIDAGSDSAGGGIKQNEAAGSPSHWLTYVRVADVAAAARKAKSLGGQVVHGATDVPGMGTFAILADPTGAPFGVWKDAR